MADETPAEVERLKRELADAEAMAKLTAAYEKALEAHRKDVNDPKAKAAYRDASAALADGRNKIRQREIDAGRRHAGIGVKVGGRKS